MTNKSPSPITNATPEQKLETLFEDQALRNAQRQRDAGTFLLHTHSDEGGRFAKPMNVVGVKPVPEYPAGPNWSPQAVGVEPPLGFSIDEMEPVGRQDEIEASIEKLERAQTEALASSSDADAAQRGAEENSDRPSLKSPRFPFPTNKRDR
jgi:hypothetical protein